MSTEAITKKIADYFKTQPVVKAWLFGSFARGEETSDSDVDILVLQRICLFLFISAHRQYGFRVQQ